MGESAFFSVGAEAIVLRVKAKPHSREDAVLGVRAGELLVTVRAAAENGRANAEIVRVLAKALGVPRDRVVLKSGAGASHKVFIVPLEAAAALRGFDSAVHI
jgi:uncharacterized protein YggU (UPF0235/DUF167 family)